MTGSASRIKTKKVGRNDPCHCGSGKKYKQCCGRLASTGSSTERLVAQTLQAALEHHQAGRLAEADAHYRRILQAHPNHPDALHYLGVIAYQLGKNDIACELIRRAISANPSSSGYYANLGNALNGLERFDEAVASFRKALSLKPDIAEAHNNLGVALQQQGKPQEALASYRQALSLKPDYHEAYHNVGNVLKDQGKLDEAIVSYRKALSLKPDSVLAHNNLANAFLQQGKLAEAVASYRQALACKPDFAMAHNYLGNALREQGKLSEAIASYRQALTLQPDYAEANSNLLFTMQFLPLESPAPLMAECERFSAQFEAPLSREWQRHRNVCDPRRRLKVGYVSPDFRRHAVAYFIEPVLAQHDKSHFEVFCYYNHALHDELTDRLAGYADRWLDCKRMSDEQLAEHIRSDGIDILVDLAGHTAGNRILTFARKPAPIQITYLGYPGTSGLAAMDYRLTDAHADPEGSEGYYTEKLLRLPDCLCCYRPGKEMPEVATLPAQHNGYVTFGSFNNFNKINRACIELWAQLLRAVPESWLLMVTVPEGELRRELTEQFAALGVAAERLELHGRLPSGEFLRLFQRADIALDPFPVTGGTTTCDSLWMGVPVVVLVGRRYISRVGLSFLSAAGLPELAADTAEGYLEVATKLAADLPRLAALRAGLRSQMAGSALTNETAFTRNLEHLYRKVWTEWCNAA